jgi:hypothetical protein
MGTPYRIEYTNNSQNVSIAGHSDGYPRDVILGEILVDLPTIKNNPKEYIADIAIESQDYYGRQIDEYGNHPFDYCYTVDVQNNTIKVTYAAHQGVSVTINPDNFTPETMGEDFDIMFDEVQYGFECVDQETLEMIESYGHKVIAPVEA